MSRGSHAPDQGQPGADGTVHAGRRALLDGVLFSFPDEQSYVLRDAEAEVLFSFSLEESLRRARVSPLFKVRLGGKSDKGPGRDSRYS